MKSKGEARRLRGVKVPRSLSEAEYLFDELMKYLDEYPELRT